MVDKIKDLCALKRTTLHKVEQELGFANGSLAKSDIKKISYDRILKLTKYFNVPINYFDDCPEIVKNELSFSAQEQDIILALRKQPEMTDAICRLLGITPHHERHSAIS